MKPRAIKDIQEFKKLARNAGGLEYYIMLKGNARSTKHCVLKDNSFYMYHYIDGSQELMLEEDFKKTISFEAIQKGCCFKEGSTKKKFKYTLGGMKI